MSLFWERWRFGEIPIGWHVGSVLITSVFRRLLVSFLMDPLETFKDAARVENQCLVKDGHCHCRSCARL